MNTGRTRFLRQTSNQLFHLLTDGHHQVSKLIHQHDDVRQFFQHRMLGIHAIARLPVRIRNRTPHAHRLGDFLVITGQVTHAQCRHQLVAAFHLVDAPAQGVGSVFHVGDHFRQQMRDTFIDGQFEHFRVDHDETHIFRLRFVEHAEDHGVHPDGLTGTGRTGHQQVRHFREVCHHRIAGDIFTQHDGQWGWVITELGIVQHFTQVDGLTFLIRQFKTDIRFTRNNLYNTHRHGRQRPRQVTGKVRNTRGFYARRQVQFETGDDRTRGVVHHIRLNAEVSQTGFHQTGHLLQSKSINRLDFSRRWCQQIQ